METTTTKWNARQTSKWEGTIIERMALQKNHTGLDDDCVLQAATNHPISLSNFFSSENPTIYSFESAFGQT